MAKRQKMALSLTPQAMYNQFKKPSAGSVSELYYIYIFIYFLSIWLDHGGIYILYLHG